MKSLYKRKPVGKTDSFEKYILHSHVKYIVVYTSHKTFVIDINECFTEHLFKKKKKKKLH